MADERAARFAGARSGRLRHVFCAAGTRLPCARCRHEALRNQTVQRSTAPYTSAHGCTTMLDAVRGEAVVLTSPPVRAKQANKRSQVEASCSAGIKQGNTCPGRGIVIISSFREPGAASSGASHRQTVSLAVRKSSWLVRLHSSNGTKMTGTKFVILSLSASFYRR